MLDDFLQTIQSPWKRVGYFSFFIFSAGFCALIYIITHDQDGFIPILDHANLVFHEAGHPVFGLFGNTIGYLGGTLGQLAFPLILLINFWYRRETLGCAVMGVWFFQNFLNIARYIGDARARLLPLVGGGEHDWFILLSRWHILSWDTTIARGVSTIGWTGMCACWVWLFVRMKKVHDREKSAY